ncbi:Hop1 [Histomonas meleagridis]|uniref:Hop1 n=1 Tax=Histomonas meleagridis TaxID=135588 RepID=UPI003559E175|nr:Hop1 [Histomonas meleagridis]KAH0802088.1 Hop1 [Histomonas meleagridis]
MTRLAQKTRQATDTCTEVQSMTLVRNIIRSSISSISYLRYLFPEDNFTDTNLAGLKIKSLVPNSNPEIEALTNWIEKGAFDALQHHYLRALVFSIFSEPNNPSSLIESYTFKFSYPSDGSISFDMKASMKGKEDQKMTYMSREQIQQAWCTMIRTLITISHALPPLPSERFLSMRLYYYDDVTPPDYEPPGFSCATETPNYEFVADSELIEIGGSVNTKYHSVSLRLDTAMPNYHQMETDELDEKVELAILLCAELDYITREKLSKNLKIPKNDSSLDDIIKKLEKLGFILPNSSGKKMEVIHSSENQKLIDKIAAKYDDLDESDE